MNAWQHLVAFPSVSWDFNWERQHELISRLAAITPGKVIVHQPYGLINYGLRDVWRKFKSRQMPQPQGFQNPRHPKMAFKNPFFVPRHYHTLWDNLNAHLITKATGLPLKDCLLYTTYANGAITKLLPQAGFSVLDLAQRRQAIPELSAIAKATERKAVKLANAVFADNQATIEDYAADRSNIHYLPQGVDAARFQHATPVSALLPWKQKFDFVAGYAGSDLALDYPLLLQLIQQHPNVGFLMVGALDHAALHGLQNFDNVHCTGRISFQELANYYAVMDVGLIPYVLTDRIKGVFPTKFFEYLAAGLPVYGTALPDLLPFEGALLRLMAHKHLPLLELPSEALRVQARALAHQHSWAARFEVLKSFLPPAR